MDDKNSDTSYLADIPIENLFTYIELPKEKMPLRWWSMQTTIEWLGVCDRTIRRYMEEGKLEYKYKKVKGRKRIYFSNHSVISLCNDRKFRKSKNKEIEGDYDNSDDLDFNFDTGELSEEEEMKLNAISFLIEGLLE